MADDPSRLPAEARARALIDAQLEAAGWVVQNVRDLNLFGAQGVAVHEVTMAQGRGRPDYLLYLDRRVLGVIGAKPAGTTLPGVEWRSAMYADISTISVSTMCCGTARSRRATTRFWSRTSRTRR
ncbi:hypothetical protein L1785_18830 [Antribacter sp. KLBMP9083]|uniref:Uncharacterized protein n=1 Tax=Antribacter soli TaxID=2910976 RepID=A0AA41QHV3_9MICO|nr:hypothetical protein [Antribacter soli]MCF4123035.1 hypothetical protein [Antribacter soli]